MIVNPSSYPPLYRQQTATVRVLNILYTVALHAAMHVFQVLMASLANVGERCPLDRSGGATSASTSPWAYKQKKGKPSKHAGAPKTGPPEALALLNAHPGIDGEPLGSPAAAAATAAATPGAAAGSADDDPTIANAFSGLKPLPELPQSAASKRGRGFRGGRRGKTTPRGGWGGHSARADESGVPLVTGGARPSTAEGKAVGGGKQALARAGKDLTLAGEIRPVGRGLGGEGGGGQGALSTRLF